MILELFNVVNFIGTAAIAAVAALGPNTAEHTKGLAFTQMSAALHNAEAQCVLYGLKSEETANVSIDQADAIYFYAQKCKDEAMLPVSYAWLTSDQGEARLHTPDSLWRNVNAPWIAKIHALMSDEALRDSAFAEQARNHRDYLELLTFESNEDGLTRAWHTIAVAPK